MGELIRKILLSLGEIMGPENVSVLVGLLLLLVIGLLILVVIQSRRLKHLMDRYDLFMRYKDGKSMEEDIIEIYHQLHNIQKERKDNKELLTKMKKNVEASIAKTGLVKYNAFPGMGGNSSFALAMLNDENDGYILDVIHGRDSCNLYIREVSGGYASEKISEEEEEALKKAMSISFEHKWVGKKLGDGKGKKEKKSKEKRTAE